MAGKSLKERFEKNVFKNPTTECWEWRGHIKDDGYGEIRVNNAPVGVHRAAKLLYENVPIEATKRGTGMHWDHLCRVRHCCNPAHLELVTAKENIMRGENFSAVNAKKTHCKRGHELTEDNLIIFFKTKGKRICKTCDLERQTKIREKRRNLLGRPASRPNYTRTHCPSGHEYAGENLGMTKRGKYTLRYCKTCKRIKNKKNV